MDVCDLHDQAWHSLLAGRERQHHALLLTGQRGIGKFELATRFAATLLCEQPLQNGKACGHCSACNWFALGNHPDFRLVQPEIFSDQTELEGSGTSKKKPSQQIKIEQIRELDDFLHVGTHRQGKRVILINPADAMNNATANSLLKSLEEPMPQTVFLLVSSEPAKLLPTIRSRCQVVTINTPVSDVALMWLQQKGVADAARWLGLCGGAPYFAAAVCSGEEKNLVESLVGYLSQGAQIDVLAAAGVLERLIKADKTSAPLKRCVEWLQKWVFDLVLVGNGLPVRFFCENEATFRKLASTCHTLDAINFYRKALQYREVCEQPVNPRLFLEEVLLSYRAIYKLPRGTNV